MEYIISVKYNELGQKLTNKKSHELKYVSDFKPSQENINQFVFNEIPQQMVESFEMVDNSDGYLVSLKVGDLVKLITYKTYSYGQDSTIKIVKVKDINSKGIYIEDYKNPFDFNGVEISRKKKDISEIIIPNEDDLKTYFDNIRYNELINELESLIQLEEHYTLNNEQLEAILKIFNRE